MQNVRLKPGADSEAGRIVPKKSVVQSLLLPLRLYPNTTFYDLSQTGA
jgi:hypothetical protein